MFSQQKLLKVIDADMQICRKALPTDHAGIERRTLELTTLTSHLEWAKRAGNDQAELEKIIDSLEGKTATAILRPYQRWRDSATV